MKLSHKSLQKSSQLQLFNSSNYEEENSLIEWEIDTNKGYLPTENKPHNLTPDTKAYSNKKKPRRSKGQGTGHLFKKPYYQGDRKYEQWWYQWEENGIRKSRHVKKDC